MTTRPLSNEETVKACYNSWSGNYYDNYYGEKASYPPVHFDILRNLLLEAGVRLILDAGCGPASFLRGLVSDALDLYGFDLSPEMVAEAERILIGLGLSGGRTWVGSVLSPEAFHLPNRDTLPDAVVCAGVLPHIPEESDELVLANLKHAVRPGGLVALEARNALFSMFTLNRYSYDFITESLIKPGLAAVGESDLPAEVGHAMDDLKRHFRMDIPPRREGYDQILSRTHNPLVLKEQFQAVGFCDVRLLFYHYHCLPPILEDQFPEFFRSASLAMENPRDWRGHFMASAFILAGRRCD